MRRDDRGQALIEFALILPIMLLLMVGMLEFARAWNLHQVMTDAAREGARRAVLADASSPTGQTKDSVKAAIWRYLAQAGYDPSKSTVMGSGTITPDANWKQPGKYIVVTLSCPYRFFILPGQSITMRTVFTMRNE